MSKSKIGVLGSGTAGLTIALKLQKELSADVTIFEKGTAPGGRLRTLEVEGNMYDIGATIITPHLLDTIKKELDVNTIETVKAYLDIYATEDMEPMRLDIGLTTLEDVEHIVDKGFFPTADMFAKVGIEGLKDIGDLTKISMMEYLNSMDSLPDRMKTFLSAGFVAANIAIGEMEATGFDLLAFSHDFHYPKGGVGQIANKMAEAFEQRGGKIHYNAEVVEIESDDDEVEVKIKSTNSEKIEEFEFDYVVSNMGVDHTLKAIDGSGSAISSAKSMYKMTKPTIQPTLLMFKMKNKPDFKANAGMVLYYPINSMEGVNQYIKDVQEGKNPTQGFYIHYPAMYDPDASKVGEYPIQLWFPSTRDPSDEDVEKFIAYGKEHMDKHFISNFSEEAELVKVFRPTNAIPIYNHPGTVAQIGPYVGYPVFEAKLTDRVWMAGSGVAVKFSPSTIQAQMSALAVSKQMVSAIQSSSQKDTGILAWLKKLFS